MFALSVLSSQPGGQKSRTARSSKDNPYTLFGGAAFPISPVGPAADSMRVRSSRSLRCMHHPAMPQSGARTAKHPLHSHHLTCSAMTA
eukprot:1185411-Prorocentrum_minimum.AAC.4